MDGSWTFWAAAAALVAVVMAVLLPWVWRTTGRRPGVATGTGRRQRNRLLAGLALGVPAVAVALYAVRGDVAAAGDQRAALSEALHKGGMPTEDEAAAHIYAELQRHLTKQPDDPRAQILKARMDMRAGRFEDAVVAFGAGLSGNSKAAKDPGVWVEYAEARGMAQGRTLIGEPQKLIEKALALNALHPQALDLAGSAAWERQEWGRAAEYWKRLLDQIAPEDARHVELSKAIERAEQRARLSLREAPARQ